MKVEADIPLLIRIGSLARLTGVPVMHLWRLADNGLIPTCRVRRGCDRRFPRDEAIQRVREVLRLNL